MWGLIIAYSSITAFNVVVKKIKENNSKNNFIKNMESKGYDVNEEYVNLIFKYFENNDDMLLYETESILNFIPIGNIFMMYFNAEYLLGNKVNAMHYKYFEECDKDNKEELIKKGIIKENIEKKQMIKYQEAALKKLESKYNNMTIKEKDVIIATENDSVNELTEKLNKLSDLLEKKMQEEKTQKEGSPKQFIRK